VEKGIIDPVKVVTNSLQFASGAAGILLSTDISIINEHKNIHVREH
jgi:chaperonin GroEL (HSP60 family)